MELKHYPVSLEDWQNRVIDFWLKLSEQFTDTKLYNGSRWLNTTSRIEVESEINRIQNANILVRSNSNTIDVNIFAFGSISNHIQNRIYISKGVDQVSEILHSCFQTTYNIENIELEQVITFLHAKAVESQQDSRAVLTYFEELKGFTAQREQNIVALEEQRTTEIANITASFEKQLRALTKTHQQNLTDLQQHYDTTEASRRDNFEHHTQTNSEQYRHNINQLTNKYKDTIDALHEHQVKSDELRQETIERYEKEYNERAQRRIDVAEQRFNRRKVDLEQKYEQKKQKLDERWSKRQREIQAAHAKLDARAKALDAVDSKSVRRGIRQDIKKAIAHDIENPELSESTNHKRRWVMGMFIIIMAGQLGFAIFFLFNSPEAPSGTVTPYNYMEYVMYYIRQTGLIVAFVLTGFYYIRWQDRWSAQHAQREFGLKQFQLDMERASWVVEMALEWKQETENELPEQLSKQLSNNLFDDKTQNKLPETSPADHIASALLGSASKLDLDVQGQKLTLDRKGVQQLQRPTPTAGYNNPPQRQR